MTAGVRPWRIRLTAAAEADFEGILQWTVEHFGQTQARAYAETLSAALQALAEGPEIVGATARNDIAKGLFSLHVARQGRQGRHFVIFRIGDDRDRGAIEVLRLLHYAMDLSRHLPKGDEPE